MNQVHRFQRRSSRTTNRAKVRGHEARGRHRLAILLLAIQPMLAIPALAAPAAAVLPPIEVIGETRLPATVDTPEQARRRLAERAGGTALVKAESYRDQRVSTLTDALGYAAGVFVQPRFGAEEARLSIRGSGIQRTFHGRGIELLQDGVPLNLADGSFDFQAVEPLSTQYIEIHRGANALEYGAATLGGAINFVSPTGYDAPLLTLRGESGSFAYLRTQVAAARVNGPADGYLSLTGFGQDGFRDHARQENYRLFGNAGLRFGDTLDGRLYLTHVDTRSALPGSLTFAEFKQGAHRAAPGNLALDQRRDFELTRVAGKLAWQPAAGQSLTFTSYFADKALDHPIFQVLRQDTQDYGLDLRWRADGHLNNLHNLLTAGFLASAGDTTDNRFVNLAGHPGARTNRFNQRATNLKFYAENQTWLTARNVLALGGQALRARRRSADEFILLGVDESFSRRYSGFSPKLGWRYLLDDATQFYANLSRSLEPPSFGELAGGPGITQVDEQSATTTEVGVRVDTTTFWLDMAFYRARVKDELLSLTDGLGNPLGTVNADRTFHHGVEMGLAWRLAASVQARLNYLWNDFRFRDDAVFGDHDLAGIPPHQVRAELRWQPSPGLYVAPNLEWTPSSYPVDHANTVAVPDYSILGLRVGGAIGARWNWFADARNLRDRDYIATTNVVANAAGLDDRNFLPGDGRALYVGMEYRLP